MTQQGTLMAESNRPAELPLLKERLDTAVNILGEVADADICIATEKQHDGGELIVRASRETPDNPFSIGDSIPTTEDLFCHRAANSGQFLHIDESSSKDQPSHYLGFPIFDSDEKIFGVLCVRGASLPAGYEETKSTLQKFVSLIEGDLQLETSD